RMQYRGTIVPSPACAPAPERAGHPSSWATPLHRGVAHPNDWTSTLGDCVQLLAVQGNAGVVAVQFTGAHLQPAGEGQHVRVAEDVAEAGSLQVKLTAALIEHLRPDHRGVRAGELRQAVRLAEGVDDVHRLLATLHLGDHELRLTPTGD